MQKLAPATEQFQHFVSNLQESFWWDLSGRTPRRGTSSLKRIRNSREIALRWSMPMSGMTLGAEPAPLLFGCFVTIAFEASHRESRSPSGR